MSVHCSVVNIMFILNTVISNSIITTTTTTTTTTTAGNAIATATSTSGVGVSPGAGIVDVVVDLGVACSLVIVGKVYRVTRRW